MKKAKDAAAWTKLSNSISYRLLPGPGPQEGLWTRLEIRWRNSPRIWQGLIVPARVLAWRSQQETRPASGVPSISFSIRCGVHVLREEGWLIWTEEESIQDVRDIEARLLAMEDGPPFKSVVRVMPTLVMWGHVQAQLFQDTWEPMLDAMISALLPSSAPAPAAAQVSSSWSVTCSSASGSGRR